MTALRGKTAISNNILRSLLRSVWEVCHFSFFFQHRYVLLYTLFTQRARNQETTVKLLFPWRNRSCLVHTRQGWPHRRLFYLFFPNMQHRSWWFNWKHLKKSSNLCTIKGSVVEYNEALWKHCTIERKKKRKYHLCPRKCRIPQLGGLP